MPIRIDRWSIMIIVSIVLLVAACTQIVPVNVSGPFSVSSAAQPAANNGSASIAGLQIQATAAPTTRPSAVVALPPNVISVPRTIAVQRGLIVQTAQFNGRVSGTKETPVAFGSRTTPVKINVKPGDTVTVGQILVEGEARDVQASLRSAQDELDIASVRLDQAQRSAQARQQQAGTNQQDAIVAAQDDLRQALKSQASVLAGAADVDKQSAEAAVLTARGDLARVQSLLADLTRPASPADLQSAQDAVANAQLVLRQSQADAARLAQGADPVTLRTAAQDVADAQTNLLGAQATLAQLTAGPNPYDLRAAERNVQRAQNALDAAKGQDVSTAKLGLADAQDQLARLKEPPTPDAREAARTRVNGAQTTLANAQDRLDQLRKGSQLAVDKANAAVASAELILQGAQAKLDALKNGVPQDQIDAAKTAADAADLQLQNAQIRRDGVYAHPTQDEIEAAQKRVDIAQKALERARQAQAQQDDLTLSQMEVDKLQQRVAGLESDLEATRLLAPFAGQVAAVQAQPGEALEAGRPAVVLAKPGDPVVRITLPADDTPGTAGPPTSQGVPPVNAGQQATVRVDAGTGTQFDAKVADVVDGPAPNTRSALVRVDWGSNTPLYGVTASVQIDVQSKPDALVVPASAVKSAGSQKYVELRDGANRRAQPVTVGISNDTAVEILSGVGEGQLIFDGTSDSGAPSPTSTIGLEGGHQ